MTKGGKTPPSAHKEKSPHSYHQFTSFPLAAGCFQHSITQELRDVFVYLLCRWKKHRKGAQSGVAKHW
jgi:hypothetical protein